MKRMARIPSLVSTCCLRLPPFGPPCYYSTVKPIKVRMRTLVEERLNPARTELVKLLMIATKKVLAFLGRRLLHEHQLVQKLVPVRIVGVTGYPRSTWSTPSQNIPKYETNQSCGRSNKSQCKCNIPHRHCAWVKCARFKASFAILRACKFRLR